jgi:hypothetical protein
LTREKRISAIRKWCRKNGAVFELDREGGKGSHYKVAVGARWTIIQSGEILPRHIDAILAQLGIPKDEIRR